MVLLCVCVCVWCVVGIPARAHQESAEERGTYCGPQSWSACACVCAYIRVHVTGGVLARGLTCVGRLSEQPHWRWPKQGAAVVKQGGLGELSGLCKVYRPKRWPAKIVVLFRPTMWLYSASVVLGSTLHLALAIFQQGIPCFGHCPLFYSLPVVSSVATSMASTCDSNRFLATIYYQTKFSMSHWAMFSSPTHPVPPCIFNILPLCEFYSIALPQGGHIWASSSSSSRLLVYLFFLAGPGPLDEIAVSVFL